MSAPNEILDFSSRDEWRDWLAAHHADQREAWVAMYKVRSSRPGLRYNDAVEEALCFGWIDGLTRGLDADRFAQRFTPRKATSVWSLSNIARVQKLISQGRMTPAGMALVEAAQANGQWEAARQREEAEAIPADLAAALRRRKGAIAAFRQLPPSHRKQYLYWLAEAKRPETRARRVGQIVERVDTGRKD